ncbi:MULTISPECIES: hypothetical protein [Ligilactobacillus]|uniref:Uncharacterized protein n=2 Tax=Ligilactobacillus TaxID=2767887 RepID=A0ABV4DT45_9LACO|nr:MULTISPECIES: hypothetical protein [Ligilactobacillus]MBL1055435.1 hypothetical protein [Ligilactobacillus agilis]MDQ2234477.1 hypothetical protein [Ligilactobacillus animalis]GET10013.1 hypothetical protein SN10121_05030 [Ligilactobacillus agilis]
MISERSPTLYSKKLISMESDKRFNNYEVRNMKLQNMKSGYMPQTYTEQFGNVIPRVLIGSGIEVRVKFDRETNRPVETGEIDSKRAWLYFPGLGVQSVKLPADFELPKGVEDLAEVELELPEACIVGREIYVRAKGLKTR